jgi:hypothetical protein
MVKYIKEYKRFNINFVIELITNFLKTYYYGLNENPWRFFWNWRFG